ncbi:hypothetical protein TNCT6_38220 [Streptomyces sp. 6-11-2]|nr:hypothetical protein TNCT6_38220 [Streptomyces sp. 6-11-2]
MRGELTQVVTGGTAGLTQFRGQLGRGGRPAAPQRGQQPHAQGVCQTTQRAGIKRADPRVQGFGHAYKDSVAKKALQQVLWK